MLSIDQTLNDGTSNHTYSLVSVDGTKSIRKDATQPLDQPKTLTVSHSDRIPSDPKSPRRHLVRLDRTKLDSLGVPQQLSVYAVLEIPKNGTFVAADADALKNELQNFLTGSSGAFFNKWINDEP